MTAMAPSLQLQLASLRSLLGLSLLMTTDIDERQIVSLAATATASLAQCPTEAVYLDGTRVLPVGSRVRDLDALDAQLARMSPEGGAVRLAGRTWAYAYPLTGLLTTVGYFVVGALTAPDEHQQFLLRALGQQAGVALVAARLRTSEREAAKQMRVANDMLTRSLAIHRMFTQVAMAGDGEVGIAAALHEITGRPVAIEDRGGGLRVWTGPGRPEPYPPVDAKRRDRLVNRLLAGGEPMVHDGRLVALARTRGDVLGVIALVDAGPPGDEGERIALEHAATVLTTELMRIRSIAETELRIGGDLVDILVSGTSLDAVRHRLDALGCAASALRHTVVVEGRTRRGDEEAFFLGVRRAALDTGLGGLIGRRDSALVMVCPAESSWDRFHAAVRTAMPGGRCRVGVGSSCDSVTDLPRSYREALLALRLQGDRGGGDGVTQFDELGIFRLMSKGDTASIERIVRQWLGPLLDYDVAHNAELTETLGEFLELGGHYAATAKRLSLHPSTLKYRLRRIREISGLDLTDPDVRFNLQTASRAWRTLEAIRRM
ncbi:MAG TPA: helix-turn-helix domain-containing protein [Mycobacteriales bacterium]|nr:helix-turn-helix domain-containing protein [Mycobacteriales bacterium]